MADDIFPKLSRAAKQRKRQRKWCDIQNQLDLNNIEYTKDHQGYIVHSKSGKLKWFPKSNVLKLNGETLGKGTIDKILEHNPIKEGPVSVNEYVNRLHLTGSVKQIKWAKSIILQYMTINDINVLSKDMLDQYTYAGTIIRDREILK